MWTVAIAAPAGCSRAPGPAKPDGEAIESAADTGVASNARGRRRRRRIGVRTAAAGDTAARNARGGVPGGATPSGLEGSGGDPGAATADDLALADDTDNAPAAAPRQRARMTETGPTLPEDLGRPADQTLDMTQSGAGAGPMGLDPSQISRGMHPLMHRLANCADATTDDNGHGPHGHVTVRLRIRPSGAPAAARVSGGGGPPEFTLCVRRVVASARFDSFRGPDAFATWGFDVD